MVAEPPSERQSTPSPAPTAAAPTSSPVPVVTGTPKPPTPPKPTPTPEPNDPKPAPTACVSSNATGCNVDADCGIVTGGCYCGPNPAAGVNRSYRASVQTCLDDQANSCFLACDQDVNYRTDRSNVTVSSLANVGVACDQTGEVGVCYTYVIP